MKKKLLRDFIFSLHTFHNLIFIIGMKWPPKSGETRTTVALLIAPSWLQHCYARNTLAAHCKNSFLHTLAQILLSVASLYQVEGLLSSFLLPPLLFIRVRPALATLWRRLILLGIYSSESSVEPVNYLLIGLWELLDSQNRINNIKT